MWRSDWRSPNVVVVFVVLVVLSYLPFVLHSTIGFVLAALLFCCVALKLMPFAEMYELAELGLHRHRGWFSLLTGGVVTGCFFTTIVFVTLLNAATIDVELPSMRATVLLGLFALSTAGFTAFAEELIFRGYLARTLRPRLSWTWVIVISSTLFALYHVPQWGLPTPFWIRFFVMGFVFAIPLVATKSLWMSIGLHFGGNFTFYVLLTEFGILATEKDEGVVELLGWVSLGVGLLLLGLVALTAGRLARIMEGAV